MVNLVHYQMIDGPIQTNLVIRERSLEESNDQRQFCASNILITVTKLMVPQDLYTAVRLV